MNSSEKTILDHPYLKKDLITYLGNKRKLLFLIQKAIQQCHLSITKTDFIDLFGGSGVVSRLAKVMGFQRIFVNDWEPYSFPINEAFLKIDETRLSQLFLDKGGIHQVLEKLNTLKSIPKEKEYIARYYAPQSHNISDIDYKKERLFYTRENALRIDFMRYQIEKWYPQNQQLTEMAQLEKNFLLALLIYKASIHNNTSGVFKAYHKGFGGHGKNALQRILKRIDLTVPNLYSNRKSQFFVSQQDALKFVTHFSWKKESLVYLDPPYKEHQYGSNYHLLNSIVLWDQWPVPQQKKKDGSFESKAGIRSDWVKTKSDFCSKKLAIQAFESLIQNISSHYILLSYSTDGIIDFKKLCEIVCQKGKVEVVLNEYMRYKGGRKSSIRVNKNIEFVLIIDTQKTSHNKDKKKLERMIDYHYFCLLLTKKYRKEKLEKFFQFSSEGEIRFKKDQSMVIKTQYDYQLFFDENMQKQQRKYVLLIPILEQSISHSIVEELEEIHGRLEKSLDSKEAIFFLKEYLSSLKHLAYKKNQAIFLFWWRQLETYQLKYPQEFEKIKASFIHLKQIFELRLEKK